MDHQEEAIEELMAVVITITKAATAIEEARFSDHVGIEVDVVVVVVVISVLVDHPEIMMDKKTSTTMYRQTMSKIISDFNILALFLFFLSLKLILLIVTPLDHRVFF